MKLMISLTKRLIDSLVGYGKELIGYFEDAGIPEVLTSKPFLMVKESYETMCNGYMKARKNAYTDLLFTYDTGRDNAYRAFRSIVQGLVYSDVPAQAAAALQINRLFDQYGSDFLEFSYIKETGKMTSFIQDLKKPENATCVATLQQESKVLKIEDFENKFESTYSLSVGDKAARDAYDSASAARTEFELAVRKLMSYVDLKMMESTDPKWQALCQKIVAFNTTFEQRETQRDSKEQSKKA